MTSAGRKKSPTAAGGRPRPRSVPVPGRPVRGSTTGKPLLAAMDLLGRRWALRVLWELRAGPCTFRVLQERCDRVSPASLNTRIAELRAAGLLEVEPGGYRVTALGAGLTEALTPLSAWAESWAAAIAGRRPPRPGRGAAGDDGVTPRRAPDR